MDSTLTAMCFVYALRLTTYSCGCPGLLQPPFQFNNQKVPPRLFSGLLSPPRENFHPRFPFQFCRGPPWVQKWNCAWNFFCRNGTWMELFVPGWNYFVPSFCGFPFQFWWVPPRLQKWKLTWNFFCRNGTWMELFLFGWNYFVPSPGALVGTLDGTFLCGRKKPRMELGWNLLRFH